MVDGIGIVVRKMGLVGVERWRYRYGYLKNGNAWRVWMIGWVHGGGGGAARTGTYPFQI